RHGWHGRNGFLSFAFRTITRTKGAAARRPFPFRAFTERARRRSTHRRYACLHAITLQSIIARRQYVSGVRSMAEPSNDGHQANPDSRTVGDYATSSLLVFFTLLVGIACATVLSSTLTQ